jgi:hypothetical protein
MMVVYESMARSPLMVICAGLARLQGVGDYRFMAHSWRLAVSSLMARYRSMVILLSLAR